MIYIPDSPRAANTLHVAAHATVVRRLAHRLYTDDFERQPAELVRANLLAIIARLLPDCHLSHSTAAVLDAVPERGDGPEDDALVFVSDPGTSRRTLQLPGVRIVRLTTLPAAETDLVDAPTRIGTTLREPPSTVRLRVASRLQNVLECLSRVRLHPAASLPDYHIRELIASLGAADRARAAEFAERNNMQVEFRRYAEMVRTAPHIATVRLRSTDAFDVHFYDWCVGRLTALSNEEFAFEYDPQWTRPLSRELPRVVSPTGEREVYRKRGMPTFFENFLPEGWTRSWLARTHHLDADDDLGLLSTTRKYLSNITLRPLGIARDELRFDTLTLRLNDLEPPGAGNVRAMRSAIDETIDTQAFWLAMRDRGGVRMSGVQPKLPVALSETETAHGAPVLSLGDLRHSCSHILKLQSREFPQFVENEWATMELARRVGLTVPAVCMIDVRRVRTDEPMRALLVERFDIPDVRALATGGADLRLMWQEDACSLLGRRRKEKYDVTIEDVADALQTAGVQADELWVFLAHVAFAWMTGNGDLHAKNFSIARQFAPSPTGGPPTLQRVSYTPLYDLLNTGVAIRDDAFALRLNGKTSRINAKDFARLAARWDGAPDRAHDIVHRLAHGVREQLDDVLAHSQLETARAERYREIVWARLDGLDGGRTPGSRTERRPRSSAI